MIETDDNLLSEQGDDLKLDNIDTLQIGIHANFVLETLLSLTPEQIAHFHLVYKLVLLAFEFFSSVCI